MIDMSLSQAAKLCGGTLTMPGAGEKPLGRLVIDSRKVEPGDLFAAYVGERVDGHDYIPAAFQRGAAACLAQREAEGGPLILVEDVQKAVEALASAYRAKLSLPVVAVTGSVGKTTTKEMIASVLGQGYNTHKTQGNLNNQIGLPMSLCSIGPEHQVSVLELGISGFGQMEDLGAMARPDVAVFTAIGHAHLEALIDLEGVYRAKTALLDYLSPEGWTVVNGDDPLLARLADRPRTLSCGLGENCLVRAEDIELLEEGATRFRLKYQDHSFTVQVPAFGMHLVYAALEAAAVGFILGLDEGQIARGLGVYQVVGRRGAVTAKGGITLIDDSYNANPDSMREAIDSLCLLPGRHVCLLGDMLEMGTESEHLHLELGRYALERGVDLVACTGPMSRCTAQGAGERGLFFQSKELLKRGLPELLRPGDRVLVKASRGAGFEEIADAVKEL